MQSALDVKLSLPEKAIPIETEEKPAKKARKGGLKKKKKPDVVEPETMAKDAATESKKVLLNDFSADEQEVLCLSRITFELWLSQVNAFPDIHESAREARRCINESIASLERSVPTSKFAYTLASRAILIPHRKVVAVYWRRSNVTLGKFKTSYTSCTENVLQLDKQVAQFRGGLMRRTARELAKEIFLPKWLAMDQKDPRASTALIAEVERLTTRPYYLFMHEPADAQASSFH